MIAAASCILLEKLSAGLGTGLPSGTITTVADITILGAIVYRLGADQKIRNGGALALAAAVLYLFGDFSYGLLTYIWQAGAANTNACLIYIIPYTIGMVALILIGLLNRNEFDRLQVSWILVLFLGSTALSSYGILMPALTQKSPPLATHLAVLSVAYTLLESAVISVSLVAASFANRRSLQWAALATTIIHASDLALRYQSLRPEQGGFGIYEYGWLLGLSLLLVAQNLEGLEKEVHSPLSSRILAESDSIRGSMLNLTFRIQATIMVMFFGYIAFRGEREWNETSALMIACFSVSILVTIPAARGLSDKINAITQSLTSQVNQDVSAREHELRKLQVAIHDWNLAAQSQISNSKAALDNFAHDLKSPISAIHSASEFLKSSNFVERENIELLEIARKRIESLSQSALNSRKHRCSEQDVRVAVRESVAMAMNGLKNPRIEIIGAQPDTPITMNEFGRVFSNVLANALEATPVHLPVKVEWLNGEREVVLAVTDHGGGIPADILESARRGRGRTSKPNGNGIGLKTCFEWSREHGVPLTVEPLKDGTRITWRFQA